MNKLSFFHWYQVWWIWYKPAGPGLTVYLRVNYLKILICTVCASALCLWPMASSCVNTHSLVGERRNDGLVHKLKSGFFKEPLQGHFTHWKSMMMVLINLMLITTLWPARQCGSADRKRTDSNIMKIILKHYVCTQKAFKVEIAI